MTPRFHWKITTKLFCMNIVIFAIIVAMIFVVKASFERIELTAQAEN